MEKVILVFALMICLGTDLKKQKILNIVTLPAVVFGFINSSLIGGFTGLLFSVKGFVVGIGLMLIPYLLGGMGAGDVKLMAAIGALMGTNFVFYSFIYTALIGGVIALVLIFKTYGIKNTFRSFIFRIVFFKSSLGTINIPTGKKDSISFPYGVAIVLGTFITLVGG